LRHGAVAIALSSDAVAREMLIGRYRVPQPRNALVKAIRDHASAAMDVSDGLAGDLGKLCAASGASATIDVASIPLSPAAAALLARGVVGIETLIAGGDDYEVLCTVPENRFDAFVGDAAIAGVKVTSIGVIASGSSVPKFRNAEGNDITLSRLSYSHF